LPSKVRKEKLTLNGGDDVVCASAQISLYTKGGAEIYFVVAEVLDPYGIHPYGKSVGRHCSKERGTSQFHKVRKDSLGAGAA